MAMKSDSWVRDDRGKVEIFSYNFPAEHARAAAAILEAALKGVRSLYGLTSPKLELILYIERGWRSRLWTNGKEAIHLTLSGPEDLRSPLKGGPHFVYGFCHELSHIVMYRRIKNVFSLPDGMGEGWAHYLASVGIVPYVFERLGKDAWPDSYDYLSLEGPGRLIKQIAARKNTDATIKAASVFFDLEKRWGKRAVGRALNQCATNGVSGSEFLRAFRKYIRNGSA